ncbi:MAG TPA: ABC transporter permease [Candidatus Angelobacter sp.]|nr:ABC transporter permease [Candidatus Angelobacter sp.]
MTITIALFELRQRLRRVSTYLYFFVLLAFAFLFMLIGGGAIPGVSLDFGTGGKVFVNSPYSLNTLISILNVFGVIITAALAGQATYQDIDNNCTAFFYTLPINKRQYLTGRFLGSVAVQCFIFAGIGVGAWLGSHMPFLDATRRGPDRLVAYIMPFVTIVLPNLIFVTAIFFALAAVGKKMLPVYAGGVLLFIGYLLVGDLLANPTRSSLLSLADPFGIASVDRTTHYWTPFERNTQLIPLVGLVLVNRIVWMGVSLGIFLFTYFKFNFAHHAPKSKRGRAETAEIAPVALSLPVAHPIFSFGASFRQLLSLIRLQFVETVKNVVFMVILFAGFAFALILSIEGNNPFSTPVYPVTYRVLELSTGTFALVFLIIITFISGELVWRERDAQLSQIVDALPVKGWVLFASKLLTLMLVTVPVMAVSMIASLTVQLIYGYHHFEFGHYFKELVLVQLTSYWILCVLALVVHTIVNQKYVGHFVMVLYYVAAILALPLMGFQHFLYRLGRSPAPTYSDMNTYGHFVKPVLWFHLYWGAAAILLAVVTNLFWVRGTETGRRQRTQLAFSRLSAPIRLGLAASALLFLGCGGYIFYNTNVLNTYRSPFERDEIQAQYEKRFKQYEKMPQPRITDINTQIDLYPELRAASIRGTIWVENKTSDNIERIALSIDGSRSKLEVQKLSFGGGQTAVIEEPKLGFYMYRLATPLAPHGRIALEFALKFENPGFVNAGPNNQMVENGTFIDSSYLPHIGYVEGAELGDDSTRHRHGLEKTKRLPKLEDVTARQTNYVTRESDWINLDATVSTSPDQVAIIPGYLQKEWVENGRRYFQYKTDAPILGFFSVNSGRYQVQRDRWKDVSLEIYYHPGHEYNLDRMKRGMKDTLEYCSTNFNPFQFHQLRIIEFPRYRTFAQSLANTVPFAESIGFIARIDDKDKEAVDLPYYVTAHEVGHQWWAHQEISANVEGATSMVETLAQYSALMVMKHHYGPESIKKFLHRELAVYLQGRAIERNEEKPLYRVEPNQGYIHYNKGSLVMYALQDYIGEDKVNQALSEFIRAYAFKGPPYPVSTDLIGYLRKVTPPDFQYLFDDLFENITIYDSRAKSATYTKQADGKYQVHLSVEFHKSRADGHGQEHAAPVNDWVDIGVLDKAGNYLYLQKRKFDSSNAELNLVVDKLPAQAGIDPLNKLIDLRPDDNVIRVTRQ